MFPYARRCVNKIFISNCNRMAHAATTQGPQMLHGFKRLTRFDKGLGAQLPEAYKKFWREWKLTQPAAVHYIPKEGKWERDEVTGQLRPIQNVPLPLIDPPEAHEGLWGGEAVIKGFQKRNPLKRRVPHFWVPVLRRSVVHSRVLNEYMSVVVTDRLIDKIHESHGFDHYLLKNPACDLRSLLALKLKRKILLELLNGCPTHADNPDNQKEIMQEFKCYLDAYTPEEIDWYGHTYREAIKKLQAQIRAAHPIRAHKIDFRLKLIDQLKQAGISAKTATTTSVDKSTKPNDKDDSNSDKEIEALTKLESTTSTTSSWLSRINPFGKKQET